MPLGNITPLQYFCHKILPSVYDDSLSYYELVNLLAEKLNETIEKVNEIDVRFIITFADPLEWDDERVYAQYTITTHEGVAYISKNDVPAGVPITDSEYWVPFIDIDEKIDEKISQIRAEVNTKFDEQKTFNRSVTSSFDFVYGQIDTIKDDLRKETGSLHDEIGNRIRTVQKRFAVMIGDEWGLGKLVNPQGTVIDGSGWCTRVATRMGFIKSYTYAAENVGFVAENSDNESLVTLLNGAVAAISSGERELITDVIICGGINDVIGNSPSAGLGNAASTIASAVKNGFPNAVLHVVLCQWPADMTFNYNTMVAKSNLIAGFRERAGCNIHVIDTCSNWLFGDSRYFTNGVKYTNEAGIAKFSNILVDALNGGDYTRYIKLNATAINGCSVRGAGRTVIEGNQAFINLVITAPSGGWVPDTEYVTINVREGDTFFMNSHSDYGWPKAIGIFSTTSSSDYGKPAIFGFSSTGLVYKGTQRNTSDVQISVAVPIAF